MCLRAHFPLSRKSRLSSDRLFKCFWNPDSLLLTPLLLYLLRPHLLLYSFNCCNPIAELDRRAPSLRGYIWSVRWTIFIKTLLVLCPAVIGTRKLYSGIPIPARAHSHWPLPRVPRQSICLLMRTSSNASAFSAGPPETILCASCLHK